MALAFDTRLGRAAAPHVADDVFGVEAAVGRAGWPAVASQGADVVPTAGEPRAGEGEVDGDEVASAHILAPAQLDDGTALVS